jgi:hypothetical protein
MKGWIELHGYSGGGAIYIQTNNIAKVMEVAA